ncbi:hypothetical protein ACFQY8_06970 [Alloscardovia venturai]|uniref:Uncharacterized protein n=1 Tax=Alloscardovia venturai TaxID=1769421 RepID=A0ABW2Y5F0_9BIFI
MNKKVDSLAHSSEVSPQKRTWTRPRIMRGIVTPVLIVLAFMALVMAIVSMTVLKPSKIVSASAQTSAKYVVTDEGVANVVSSQMTFTASKASSSSQGDVCVAVANSDDVDAWMAAQAVRYTAISGLSSWTQLSTKDVSQSGEATQSVAFADSDLWQEIKCSGKKSQSATVSLSGITSQQRVIAYSKNGVSQVRIQWTRDESQRSGSGGPWYVIMAALAVAALLSGTWLSSSDPFGVERRKQVRANQLAAKEAALAAGEPIVPGVNAPYEPYKKKSRTGITHRTNTRPSLLSKLFGKQDTNSSNGYSKSSQTDAQTTETVVDPSSVNLVASTGAGAADTPWSPSLINRPTSGDDKAKGSGQSSHSANLSGEELLEYLARLAVEERSSNDTPTESTEASQPSDSIHDAREQEKA